MARILCAWEFGSGAAHLARLLPIARALRATGHDVSFAFRDAHLLAAPSDAGFEAFPAPKLREPRKPGPAPLNFSDTLLNLGYADAAGLAGAMRAWHALLGLLRPQIVVCDDAPTALLASRRESIPRATVGGGFPMPIAGDPAPALRAWTRPSPEELRARDEALIAAIGAAPEKAEGVAGLFAAQADILCTFAELDPLGPRPGGEYVGPVEDSADGAEIAWRSSALPRVLASLDPRDARVPRLLDALRAMPVEAVVAIPGLDAAAAGAASSAALRVVPGPANIAALLEGATLLLCHATSDPVARAWIAGVPMALLPLQLEDHLRALRVADAGAAVVAAPEDSPADLRAWLAAALAREELRVAARVGAIRHRGFSRAAACSQAAQRIATLAS